jgi:hypothetical protein
MSYETLNRVQGDKKAIAAQSPGERGGHSSPQQSWGVFWHIFIKEIKNRNLYLWEKLLTATRMVTDVLSR